MPEDAALPGNRPGRPPRALRARRLACAATLIGTIAAGMGVHLLLADSSATDIAGDALYAVAAYAFVALVAPQLPSWAVGVIAAAWCVAVELFQLTDVPLALGAVFPPAMLALGTVFDARDLVVYAIAVVFATGADAAIRRSVRTIRM